MIIHINPNIISYNDQMQVSFVRNVSPRLWQFQVVGMFFRNVMELLVVVLLICAVLSTVCSVCDLCACRLPVRNEGTVTICNPWYPKLYLMQNFPASHAKSEVEETRIMCEVDPDKMLAWRDARQQDWYNWYPHQIFAGICWGHFFLKFDVDE